MPEICYQRQDHYHTKSAMRNQHQFHPQMDGKTPMKTLKNMLDKSCPKWFRHSWSCVRIRKRVTQLFEKPFRARFSGGPVITYRKEENHIPTYLSIHHPSFSPKLKDGSPCTGVNYRATQTQPKKTHPQEVSSITIYFMNCQSAILLLFPPPPFPPPPAL